PNTMQAQNGHLLVHADDETVAGVRKQLQTLDAIDARQFTLEVRFGEVATANVNVSKAAGIAQLAESLPQVCLATLSASRGTQLSATRHSQVILDYEATVANSIAATNPEFGTITEGFLLRGAITPMHEQMVLLDVNLTILQRDAARPVFDLKHRAI